MALLNTNRQMNALIANAAAANPYLTLPAGWNTTWLAAINSRNTTPAWVQFITDSVGQGFYADDMLAHGWVGLLIAALKARYPTEYAEHWPIADSAYLSTGLVSAAGIPWVVNDTAHAAPVPVYFGCLNGVRWAGDAHPSATLATCTTPVACTALDLVWMQHYAAPSGTWTYTIDGGAPQTVTIPAANNVVRKQTITGLAQTTHTIVFTGQSVDNNFILLGASCYPNGIGSAGLGYARTCLQGVAASGALQSGVPAGLGYQYFAGQGATLYSPTPFGFPAQPQLAVIELGINDCQNQTPTQYGFALSKIIESLRQGRANVSILLNVPCNPDVNTSDIVSNTLLRVSSWGTYTRIAHQVASAYNCAVVDFAAKWGSTPVAQGFLSSTGHGPHPTTAGHAAVANTLMAVL